MGEITGQKEQKSELKGKMKLHRRESHVCRKFHGCHCGLVEGTGSNILCSPGEWSFLITFSVWDLLLKAVRSSEPVATRSWNWGRPNFFKLSPVLWQIHASLDFFFYISINVENKVFCKQACGERWVMSSFMPISCLLNCFWILRCIFQ